MALLGRMAVIALALLGASFAAAVVLNLATRSEPSLDILLVISAILIATVAFAPALIIIVLAEAWSLRSALFYGLAGGAVALVGVYAVQRAMPSDLNVAELLGCEPFGIGQLFSRTGEVLAAAGIAAGFVYWLIAGRNAGVWRTPPPPPLPAP